MVVERTRFWEVVILYSIKRFLRALSNKVGNTFENQVDTSLLSCSL